MRFPLNIIVSVIVILLVLFITNKIFGRQHILFKYLLSTSILCVIYVIAVSLFQIIENILRAQLFLNSVMLSYPIIFVPFFGGILYSICKKLLLINGYSKVLIYLVILLFTFFTIGIFIIGFYIFVYTFYGFAP